MPDGRRLVGRSCPRCCRCYCWKRWHWSRLMRRRIETQSLHFRHRWRRRRRETIPICSFCRPQGRWGGRRRLIWSSRRRSRHRSSLLLLLYRLVLKVTGSNIVLVLLMKLIRLHCTGVILHLILLLMMSRTRRLLRPEDSWCVDGFLSWVVLECWCQHR